MKNLHLYICFVVLGVLQFSCDKMLSEPPANARVDGTAITDQKSAQIVLNGAYYRFANVGNVGSTTTNITRWSDLSIAGGLLSGAFTYGTYEGADQLNNNANTRHLGSVWAYCYTLINQANGVIKGVEMLDDTKFTDNRKSEIIAEARFLRAFGHFKALMYYGEWFKSDSEYGVVLRDQLSTLSSAHKKRSTVAESYAAILDDLNFAIANAPVTNPNHYASKWTAMLLKMRVLMSQSKVENYPEVIAVADDIIQNSGFVLESNLKELFHTKGLASAEVLLGIKPQLGQEGSYNIYSRTFYPGASDINMATQFLRDLFDGDPRQSWMVGPANNLNNPVAGSYYYSKFIPYGSATSQITETVYVMRLSEVYLLKAEAIIRSGGDLEDARAQIRTVMSKGGVTDFSKVNMAITPETLLVQNYFEVLRNLAGEDGVEWMTLMRLPFETVKVLKPTITSPVQFYFPVPQSEFESNPLFGKQNPGYGA